LLWADKVRPYVESWAAALDDVIFEDRPHSDDVFADYLRWYLPRTRTHVVQVPPEAPIEPAVVSKTYPLVRDQNFVIAYDVIRAIESEASSSMGHYHDMTPAQHQSTLKRIVNLCGLFRRAVTCRTDDTLLPPRATGPVPRHNSQHPRHSRVHRHGHRSRWRHRRRLQLHPRTCLDQHLCTRQGPSRRRLLR